MGCCCYYSHFTDEQTEAPGVKQLAPGHTVNTLELPRNAVLAFLITHKPPFLGSLGLCFL